MGFANFEDVEAIKHLRSRYFRAMDMGDWETFKSVLAPDLKTDLNGSDYRFRYENRDDFVEAVSSAINCEMATHHVALHPEITMSSPTDAEGVWYLQDWAYTIPVNNVRSGTAIIKDRYKKIDGQWQIVTYEYHRVFEMDSPFPPGAKVTTNLLAKTGRKPPKAA